MKHSTHHHDSTDQKPTTTHRNRETTTVNGYRTVASGSHPETGGESDESTSEADTERDGFASYPAEVHALTHGIYMGLTSRPVRHPPEPDNADVQKESHYYRGGYVAGTLLQLAIVGVLSVMTTGAM
jgi:hypothetical protein